MSGTKVVWQGAAVCLLALALPALSVAIVPWHTSGLHLLPWLLALVPVLVLAYHGGWRGAMVAVAAGVVVIGITYLMAAAVGSGTITQWEPVLVMSLVYVVVGMGIGLQAELLHRSRDRAEALALTDELTGLPNRRHVGLVLGHDFAAAQRGRLLSVALFDLDSFKVYNDRYGHPAGDVVLRRFASILLSETRRMNTSGRYGGEEFLAVLSDTDLEACLVFAERIRLLAGDLNLSAGAITVSAGVASYHAGMKSMEDLIAAADAALYRAKSQGGDTICVAEPPIYRTYQLGVR